MGNPLQQPNQPMMPPQGASPLMPPAPQEPVSTPMPGQPMQSQGMPTGQVPGGDMASPEQREELLSMLDATKQKYSELQTGKFRSANENGAARIETLKEIFMLMQQAGADLGDPASVAAFLDRLQQTSPEMAAMFEEVLNSLLGENAPEAQQMGQNPAEFNDAAPTRGIPGMGEVAPPGPPQAPPQAPPSPTAMPSLNETVPQDIRGPVPPQGGAQA